MRYERKIPPTQPPDQRLVQPPADEADHDASHALEVQEVLGSGGSGRDGGFRGRSLLRCADGDVV